MWNLQQKTLVLEFFLSINVLLVFLFFPVVLFCSSKAAFVSTDACQDCHEEQYQSFKKFCKKTNSFQLVKKMKKGLTDAEYAKCLSCHTTGYGATSGFISEEETPSLMDPGCEVCHGPGSIHVKSESKSDIIAKPTIKQCSRCHEEERIKAFHYSPLIHAGAH